ncbi:MAG TPA: hypothetical protein VMA72_23320 [Streptosporangiaceae bacterium]|nr:hypothetical protein [Streptosporangiaceae bacterium]
MSTRPIKVAGLGDEAGHAAHDKAAAVAAAITQYAIVRGIRASLTISHTVLLPG